MNDEYRHNAKTEDGRRRGDAIDALIYAVAWLNEAPKTEEQNKQKG